jgi:hypothetical protein
MSECCKAVGGGKSLRRTEFAGWTATAALYAAIPKCPACLAGYVALWTGIGLSFAAADVLRQGMFAVCGVAVAVLLFRRGWASIAKRSM